jgi:hypothetical protein
MPTEPSARLISSVMPSSHQAQPSGLGSVYNHRLAWLAALLLQYAAVAELAMGSRSGAWAFMKYSFSRHGVIFTACQHVRAARLRFG